MALIKYSYLIVVKIFLLTGGFSIPIVIIIVKSCKLNGFPWLSVKCQNSSISRNSVYHRYTVFFNLKTVLFQKIQFRISINLLSLSSIVPGRFSKQHPVSAQSWCK